MKQVENTPHRINSISALHKLLGLPKPTHPLVSLIRNCDVKIVKDEFPASLLLNFYKISYMEQVPAKVKYGQGYYDFDEGGMVFLAPDQLLTAPDDAEEYEGFNLFVHPDFLQMIKLNEIIYLSGEGSYTQFHLENNKKITASKPLKYYEELLPAEFFLRTHQSYVVNKTFIDKYLKTGVLVMTDLSEIPVALRRKDFVLHQLSTLK